MTVAVKSKYSIQELSSFLRPGMLGLQMVADQPFNLLFKPVRESDPRVKALLDGNWWRVRKITDTIGAPATLESYNELVESDLDFSITHKVNQWLLQETTEAWQETHALLGDNCPLFDYQKDAVAFLHHHHRAMLSLSPGLGKTLTSAYAAGLGDYKNILLVCPASLLYYWKSELEKWSDSLPKKPYVSVWHRKTNPVDEKTLPNSQQFWAITNPETLTRHFKSFVVNQHWDLLVVDESIMYKHRDSLRSKKLKAIAQNIKDTWLLTGAPATRNLDDMWHQFHILHPRGYSSYWRFARRYCVVLEDQWGANVVANQKNAEKEIQKNYADIYFSRSQDDVLDIPDWIFEDVDVPMLPKQDKVYKTLREELRIKVEDMGDNEEITVNNHLSLMIRSIQVASNPVLVGSVDEAGKWDMLPQLMDVYPGPYIVWVNFIQSGLALRDRLSKLGMCVALANGSTPMLDRQLMVNTMQAGKMDALILNNTVGKFGFNITKARTAFFVERVYDDSYFQCLHRNRRIGTTHSPVVVNMRSITSKGDKTIDHVIADVLDYRTGMIKKVTARMLKEVLRPHEQE